MNGQQKWQNIRSQLGKSMKDLQPREQFAINDLIVKKAEQIMQKQSLSLIYDEYGNQLYEKTSDIKNYISCKKTGASFILYKDDTRLIETKNQNDEFNTDFISYDSIDDIHKNEVKWEMDIDTDFKENNDNRLYIVHEQEKRKERIFNDGINEIINYINFDGKKDFNKINKDFITFVK